MPYIKQKDRKFILKDIRYQAIIDWLYTVPVEKRKGFIAFMVEYMALYSFDRNYFGLSTGLDAVRSACLELKKELEQYEKTKADENGAI